MLAWIGAVSVYALVTSVTPGPNNLMLAASGLRFGFVRTLPHLLGILVGFAIMMAAVAVGLGALFSVIPWLQLGLKIVGSLYLLWLAWHIWVSSSLGDGSASARPLGFWRAAGFQWANPKAWVMTLTAAAGFLAPGPDYGWRAAIVVAAFAIVGAPSIGLWAAFGAGLRRWLSPARVVIVNRVLAVATALTIILFWV